MKICEVHSCDRQGALGRNGAGRWSRRRLCASHVYRYRLLGRITIIRESDPL